jgi:RNA polymerase sigma-70 factor (sigma-E family)
MLGDEAEAEDVVMDAFVATFGRWRRVDPERIEAYLRRAVVNACRTRLRRSARRRTQPLRASPVAEASERVSLDAPLRSAILALPERQRACVALHYVEDMSIDAVADILGCTAGTVKSQLSKARASMREALEPLSEEWK